MARRLVAWGHEVHMVTSDRGGEGSFRGWRQTDEDGIRVHWLAVPYANAMSHQRRLRAFARFALGAAWRAARLPGDVIFATSTPLTIALPAVYAARQRGIPMVFEVRDLWPELPIAVGALRGRAPIAAARWLERFAYRNAARVVALSPGMCAGIIGAGYPQERVSVIPNGADIDLFDVPADVGQRFRSRFDWLQDRPLVVYAGTIGQINGVEYLARVAADTLSRDPRVCYLIVGDGGRRAAVRAAAEGLGVLGRNLFMLPSVPKLEVPSLLRAADLATSLFIDLPEMWANSANKFFDALASGTPIAINYGGWQADLLREAGAGVVLDPHDTAAASERIVWALSHRAWHQQARAAARMLAEQRFSRCRLARALEAVLVEAVGQHGITKGAQFR